MRILSRSLSWVAAAAWLPVLQLPAQDLSDGARLYQVSCAPCHGSQLEGGQAQSLVDAVWQFGSKRSHVFRNVKYGIADQSMPAFDQALTDEQINTVLDFILAREKSSGVRKPPPPEVLHTLDYEVRVERWLEGLDLPWAMTFLSEEVALVTERSGVLIRVENGQPKPVEGVPAVVHEGQGGLLDVAVDPDYDSNGWIYLCYSHAHPTAHDNGRPRTMTRVVRGRLHDGKWTEQQVVFEAKPDHYSGTRHHYGSRIVFDPEGHLYFSVGDRGREEQAQDLSRPNGKVHRLHRDGTIPDDNPHVSQPNALPSIFTFGNRNPQGLAFHPGSGQLWESEHGPMGGDELNLLLPGRNYGWPAATYGRNYNGGVISDYQERPGMTSPALYWKPSIAVCGIDFVRGDMFPNWRHKLLVSALKYEELRLLDLAGSRVLHQEILLKNAGRVRDVACGPDGAVYVVLNGPGMILRLSKIREAILD